MKLGIMQPYFFPYIGYFSLIKYTDKFILFDTVQFIRHGWIERNRILKQNGTWQYIHVPLKNHTRETTINNLLINNEQKWTNKIIAQIQHYKKTAPYYYKVIAILRDIFSKEYISITELNMSSLIAICNYLNIHTPIELFSKMNLTIEPVHAPDEWALNICKAMGANEYWNPPGGIDLFNRSKYEISNIILKFQKVVFTNYNQKGNDFEAGLSIIDVMMFNDPEEVNQMLDNYELS